MIANSGIVKEFFVVGSRLVPPRCHVDAAIDNCGGIASAVGSSVAGDAELLTISTNVVGLQAQLEGVDTFISTFLIEVEQEARLGPVIVVFCEVAVGLLVLVDDLWLSPEPIITPTPLVRGIDGAKGSDKCNSELHVYCMCLEDFIL